MNHSEDNKKDPWGGGDKNQGPPELDKFFRDFSKKIRSMLPSSNKQSIFEKHAKSNLDNKGFFSFLIFTIVVVIIIWVVSGFFIVGPAEQAVMLKFGKYSSTQNPGLHWMPRFIVSKNSLNIQQVSSYQYDSDMLTQDENIVNVSLVVQYRIDNARDYLFNVINPVESLKQATASALRQVIGNTMLDDILTKKRSEVRGQVEAILKNTLALYKTGLEITDVVLQPAKPPEEVTAAFDDAIKAREDEQRFINQANAYHNSVVPVAKGHAARLIQEATAYRQQVVFGAKGDTAQFSAILPVYHRAPLVTRTRMYIDAIESVLKKSSKVLVDVKNGNNMLYLPLNQWFSMNNASQLSKKISEKTNDVLSSDADKNDQVKAPDEDHWMKQSNRFGDQERE